MSKRPDAPAARRNRVPILEVLRDELSNSRSVLEIGSGTGQHAVYFAATLDQLTWQTSDQVFNHSGINAWIDFSGLDNVLPPLDIDVLMTIEVEGDYDAIFSSNTTHIMDMVAVRRMFALAGRTLPVEGIFCLYGPFNIEGAFTSESNQSFDRSLRAENPEMGIRDLEVLDDIANAINLERVRLYAMPANNMIAVWQKQGG